MRCARVTLGRGKQLNNRREFADDSGSHGLIVSERMRQIERTVGDEPERLRFVFRIWNYIRIIRPIMAKAFAIVFRVKASAHC